MRYLPSPCVKALRTTLQMGRDGSQLNGWLFKCHQEIQQTLDQEGGSQKGKGKCKIVVGWSHQKNSYL